jgi:hypothetical protein
MCEMKPHTTKPAAPPATPTLDIRKPEPITSGAAGEYDRLTLALEHADTLAYHLRDRLTELSECEGNGRELHELYALACIAQTITDKHQEILEKATGLLGMFKDLQEFGADDPKDGDV